MIRSISSRPGGRWILRLTVFAAFAASVACGGGGGGGGGTSTLTATFVAAKASPVAGDVTLQPVSASGATFVVDVAFTGIDDVFAATLTLNYDPDVLRYVSYSTTTTFFTPGSVSGNRVLQAGETQAGTVRIAASRFAGDAGTNVVGTQSLMRLTFTARTRTTGTTLAFSGNLEVCNTQLDPDLACGANASTAFAPFGGTAVAD